MTKLLNSGKTPSCMKTHTQAMNSSLKCGVSLCIACRILSASNGSLYSASRQSRCDLIMRGRRFRVSLMRGGGGGGGGGKREDDTRGMRRPWDAARVRTNGTWA